MDKMGCDTLLILMNKKRFSPFIPGNSHPLQLVPMQFSDTLSPAEQGMCRAGQLSCWDPHEAGSLI